MTEELRFAAPPVRAVELTLLFDPAPLMLTSLAPLVSELRRRFPTIVERFARVPWSVESASAEGVEYIPEGSDQLPFPWLTFANDEGHSIAFQDDRFQLRWEFGDDRGYPGYDTLRSDLETHFASFVAHTQSSTSVEVAVRRARAEYENSMPLDVPWTVARLTFGAQGTAGDLLPDLVASHTGGGFHLEDDNIVTHVDFAAFADPEDASLSLRSTSRFADDTGVDASLSLLDVAHRRLIECFDTLTTSEQQADWGRQ